jgi:hypothetical protein
MGAVPESMPLYTRTEAIVATGRALQGFVWHEDAAAVVSQAGELVQHAHLFALDAVAFAIEHGLSEAETARLLGVPASWLRGAESLYQSRPAGGASDDK